MFKTYKRPHGIHEFSITKIISYDDKENLKYYKNLYSLLKEDNDFGDIKVPKFDFEFTDTILLFLCCPSVTIGICQPSIDLAFVPLSIRHADKSAEVTCSPDDNKTSYSSLEKFFEIALDFSTKSFVTPAIAETTTTILTSFCFLLSIILATFLILSILATEVPPNFITIIVILLI